MKYVLFNDHITLQALLKNLDIIPSGGAAKAFLADHLVYLNGEVENRRGRKLRVGDLVEIAELKTKIAIEAPTQEERLAYEEEQAEKLRVQKLVKQLNQTTKKQKQLNKKTKNTHSKETNASSRKQPVRFPGT